MSYRFRHPEMAQEEDVVPARGVLAFVGVVIVVSAVLIVWTVVTVNGQFRALRPGGAYTERWLGPRHAVARVRQDLFDEAQPAVNARKRRELESYGWVDQGRGIVRIPVAEAMALVAGGKRP